jgi:hypothetical protein
LHFLFHLLGGQIRLFLAAFNEVWVALYFVVCCVLTAKVNNLSVLNPNYRTWVPKL